MGLGAARCFLFSAAVTLPAFAADPYPNQRGALTAEQLQAATAAMKSTLGKEARLPLVASGRRGADQPYPAYVVFGASPQRQSPMVTTQRRILCHAPAANTQWQCAWQTLYSYSLREQGQVFAYAAEGTPEEPALANEVVGYFAHCFARQYQRMAGAPYAGGVPAIAEVVQKGNRVTVTAGSAEARDAFDLVRNAPGPAPARCDFTLQSARIGKSGAAFPQVVQKQEPAPETEEERRGREARQAARREAELKALYPPLSGFRSTMDRLADFSVALNLLCALIAIVGPLADLRRGRKRAAQTAVLLTGATMILALAAMVFLKLAGIPESGHSLLFVIPATALAMLSGILWIIVGARKA